MFLEDEAERNECILEEDGIIYHGSFDDVAERPWNYGQVRRKTGREGGRPREEKKEKVKESNSYFC